MATVRSLLVPLGLVLMATAVVAGDGDRSRGGRSDDVRLTQLTAMVETQAQQLAELKAENTAMRTLLDTHTLQLGKCSQTAYFTAHISHATPAKGEAVLFDVIKADSAHAYDVSQRSYVIPYTGIYWVSVIADVVSDGARARLDLFADQELLGFADAADVSEAVFCGAFELQKGQKLTVKRSTHDPYASGNLLQRGTAFFVVLVHGL